MSNESYGEGLTVEHTTFTVAYRGRPLMTGPLAELALRARATATDGEVFPFLYQDPIDPEAPDAPRPVRRARIVIEELGTLDEQSTELSRAYARLEAMPWPPKGQPVTEAEILANPPFPLGGE